MATATKTTSEIPSITAEVTTALAQPDMVIKRLALYDSAETKGRHTAKGMSILRYALETYLVANIDVPDKYTATVTADDQKITVHGQNKNARRAKTDTFEQTVALPLWLASFFEDDAHFDMLFPEDETPLSDVIVALAQHVETFTEAAVQEDEDEDENEDEEDDEEYDDLYEDDDEEDDRTDEDDEDEDDEDEDPEDEEEEEADEPEDDEAPAKYVGTCMLDAEGICRNTMHEIGGEHDS